jgi:DNA topoisomerase-3
MDNPFGAGKDSLGACPKCQGAVVKGKYGPYCIGKCGMVFSGAMGARFTEKEVKCLLEGKRIFVKNLRAKSGKTYDAYLQPNGIEDFSYTDKNGKEHNGSQYKFEISFPKKK